MEYMKRVRKETLDRNTNLTKGENCLKYWLNVDIPTKSFLHSEGCRFEVGKKATPHKGIGELKRDGGWLSFSSILEAKKFFEQKYPNKTLFIHSCVDLHSE